jgi:hypothetical protein
MQEAHPLVIFNVFITQRCVSLGTKTPEDKNNGKIRILSVSLKNVFKYGNN